MTLQLQSCHTHANTHTLGFGQQPSAIHTLSGYILRTAGLSVGNGQWAPIFRSKAYPWKNRPPVPVFHILVCPILDLVEFPFLVAKDCINSS